MKTSTIVVIVMVVLALLFFVYTVTSSGSPAGNVVSNYPSGGYIGSGCGR